MRRRRPDYSASKDIEKPLSVEFNGDTVLLLYKFDKTIFSQSNDQILRYFKGRYFLNFKESDNFWTVKTLMFDKEGILTIDRIYGGEEEIQKIKDITPVMEITDEDGNVVDYKVKPTKKEFKELIKSDLFKGGKRFKKIIQ